VLNPLPKENQDTSAGYYQRHHFFKIVAQAAALLPDSESGLSNYLSCLKIHPGPNMALFFIPRALMGSPCFYPPYDPEEIKKVKRP
jgi:hypothetical protein